VSEIEGLLDAYEHRVKMPWERSLAGPQKVWFAIYEPTQERRLRLHIKEFQIATEKAGHPWVLIDLTDAFAQWMAHHRYRDAYFEEPEDMDLALQDFARSVAAQITAALTAPEVDENTVVAIVGLASLFGLTRDSWALIGILSRPTRRLELPPARRPRWLELSRRPDNGYRR